MQLAVVNGIRCGALALGVAATCAFGAFGRAEGLALRRGFAVRAAPGEDTMLFLWWNLQNLMDTLPNSGPRNVDFVPEGRYRWNSPRYYAKLYAVGRGLAAAAGGQVPDAIGVCEVENAEVLDDLERRWPPEWRLWRLHRDSPDGRGIDVALWYNPERLRVDSVAWIHPPDTRPTREALWVRWTTSEGRSLTWLWVHLPSQRAPSPDARAVALKGIMASLEAPPDGLAGDLNEGISGPLGRYLRSAGMQPAPWSGPAGTYAYRGRLEALDGVWTTPGRGLVLRGTAVPFGLKKSATHGYRVRGTFEGTKYVGGASDHLPVRILVHRN